MTSEEGKALLLIAGVVLASVFAGYEVGSFTSERSCPEPQYDVNRVVKMHEEARQCAAELEEARDNVLVCGRLLKRALE